MRLVHAKIRFVAAPLLPDILFELVIEIFAFKGTSHEENSMRFHYFTCLFAVTLHGVKIVSLAPWASGWGKRGSFPLQPLRDYRYEDEAVVTFPIYHASSLRAHAASLHDDSLFS